MVDVDVAQALPNFAHIGINSLDDPSQPSNSIPVA